MSVRLLAATNNRDKLREIRFALEPLGFEIVSLEYIEPYPEPEETGTTLLENALIKAREGFRHSGLPSIADDTGLEVETLGGAPGVYSSRYAGPDVTYQQNVEKLLKEMAGVSSENRKAVFRTVIAIVSSNGERSWEGVCEGEITTDARGANGFGYDPLFLPAGFKETFAEMSLEQKNRISHRGRALQAMAEDLSQNRAV